MHGSIRISNTGMAQAVQTCQLRMSLSGALAYAAMSPMYSLCRALDLPALYVAGYVPALAESYPNATSDMGVDFILTAKSSWLAVG